MYFIYRGVLTEDEFLALVAHIYQAPNDFGSQLRTSAARGEIDNVASLIQRGCDPNGRDGNGWRYVWLNKQ